MSEELKAAQARIACLEGEIAKRDAIIYDERIDADLQRQELDAANSNLAGLRAELSAIKAQEPVEYQLRALIRDVTNIPEAGYYMPQSWHDQVIALSLSGKLDAPVSEAKAQGVVMPEQDGSDAGLVEALSYQSLFDAIAAATSVYANGAINISVQAFRESLAAHRAKGVV